MQKRSESIKSALNSNGFKIVLFAVIIASIIKLIMNLCGHGEWYSVLLERQFTKTQSAMIYYGILLLMLVLYFATIQEGKKWKHILFIALIPLSIYITFFRYKIVWLYGVISFFFITLMVLDIGLLRECYKMNSEFSDRESIKDYVKEFFWDASKTISGVMIYAAAATLYMAGFSHITNKTESEEPIAYATNMRDLQTTTPENLWEPNQEYLKLLAEDVYCTLTTQERLNALQQFLNIECEYLGIEPCQLIMEDLLERNIGGYYRDEDRVISIEHTYVEKENSLYGMHILLHEVYHCYQYDCVRNYQALQEVGVTADMSLKYYRDCAKWTKEFENYKSCNDTGDFAQYYQYASQSVETSADEYRNMWLGAYWEYINNIGKEEMTPEELLEEVG